LPLGPGLLTITRQAPKIWDANDRVASIALQQGFATGARSSHRFQRPLRDIHAIASPTIGFAFAQTQTASALLDRAQ